MAGLEILLKQRGYLLSNKFLAACLQDLSLVECSKALLSVENIGRILEDINKSDCRVQLGRALLPLLNTGATIRLTFSKLLPRILEDSYSIEREAFLDSVWENTEILKKNFGISLIEELAEKYPKYLEVRVLNMFDNVINNGQSEDAVLNSEKVLIKLCVESSIIFSLVSSIMNEILSNIRNVAFSRGLILIRAFVFNVSLMCTQNGTFMIDLYPQQCRNLLYLMNCLSIVKEDITSRFDGCVEADNHKDIENNMLENFHKALEEKPHEVIALLSHQGAWCTDK